VVAAHDSLACFLPPPAQPSVKADRDANSQHRYITPPLGKNSRQEVNDQNYGTQTDIVALEHMRERDCYPNSPEVN